MQLVMELDTIVSKNSHAFTHMITLHGQASDGQSYSSDLKIPIDIEFALIGLKHSLALAAAFILRIDSQKLETTPRRTTWYKTTQIY